MASYHPPTWEHARTRFQSVTDGVIEKLQRDFFYGYNLGYSIPDISKERAEIMVAESLEADRLWNLPPQDIFSKKTGSLKSDFKRAALYEILYSVYELSRDQKEPSDKTGIWWTYSMATLEEILKSPTASPLLWYEDIYWEVAQAASRSSSQEGYDWLVRSLAHNLKQNEGNNALTILQDLAILALEQEKLDHGIRILTEVIHQNPSNIWVYNTIAIYFEELGLCEIGTLGTQRGLELINEKGDKEQLRDQLNQCMQDMKISTKQRRETYVSAEVLSAFHTALSLGFNRITTRPLDQLCHTLIPSIAKTPVKRPMRPEDFPLPDRATILHELQTGQPMRFAKKRTKRGRRGRKKDQREI